MRLIKGYVGCQQLVVVKRLQGSYIVNVCYWLNDQEGGAFTASRYLNRLNSVLWWVLGCVLSCFTINI